MGCILNIYGGGIHVGRKIGIARVKRNFVLTITDSHDVSSWQNKYVKGEEYYLKKGLFGEYIDIGEVFDNITPNDIHWQNFDIERY